MKYKFKKVLVTGGGGCIGIAVCNELRKRNINCVLFDLYEQISLVEDRIPENTEIYYGSVLDKSSIREAIRGCDAIIHLAAYLGVRRTEGNSLRCLEININGTNNLLNIAVASNIRKIVFASSSEVYGEPLNNPVTENEITQGKTVYAISKLAGEELIKSYASEYQFEYSILRYFNTYGPYQVAQFVIPKFLHNVLNNKPPVIYGDGKQERSFNYVDDTARATVDTLLIKGSDGETMNIGNSKALISLLDLGKLIIELCNKSNSLDVVIKNTFNESDRNKNREIYKRYCCTEKAKKIIGYEPLITLNEGLKKVIKAGILRPKWATSERKYTIDEYM